MSLPYDPVARFQKWLTVNVKDPLPMDDKSRLHEYLDILSSESQVVHKDFALKGIGVLAIKYSASPIILCGAIPIIKEQLQSDHPTLIAQSIRTLTFISKHGGHKDILEERLHILIRNVISKKELPQYVKDIGLKFYFAILDMPLENHF